jgi:3-methyladenine DNA glycosylase Tag
MNRCGRAKDELAIRYHERKWGVSAHDDHHWLAFRTLEGAQAGLNWSLANCTYLVNFTT